MKSAAACSFTYQLGIIQHEAVHQQQLSIFDCACFTAYARSVHRPSLDDPTPLSQYKSRSCRHLWAHAGGQEASLSLTNGHLLSPVSCTIDTLILLLQD
jgi:hypothetical protein